MFAPWEETFADAGDGGTTFYSIPKFKNRPRQRSDFELWILLATILKTKIIKKTTAAAVEFRIVLAIFLLYNTKNQNSGFDRGSGRN